MGFLIKTRKPCVVYDVEGCVGEAVCLCDCVAGKGGGGGSYSGLDYPTQCVFLLL